MRLAWWVAMSLLTLMAGCAAPDRLAATDAPATPAASTASKSTAEDLLAYLARIRGSSDAALAAEAARQRREPGDLARVKAALALSLSAQSDDADIASLVDPVTHRESADRDVRSMAAFVHALAAERRRLRENAAAAQGRARDERRLAESQKQRADALQAKLDALTQLEKSLADREVPAQ